MSLETEGWNAVATAVETEGPDARRKEKTKKKSSVIEHLANVRLGTRCSLH